MLDNYFKQAQAFGSTAAKSIAWLDAHKELRDELATALIGFNELPFAIQIFGGSGDKFREIDPWHHVFFEAEQDLDSAILLLLAGFYKDSFRSLRSFFELYIFALYHFVSDDGNAFREWLHGKSYTPKLGQLLKVLKIKSVDFQALNHKLNWEKQVESLYKELSGFMHTRGALHTHTSLRNSNQTVFSETGIKIGTSLLLRAIRLAGMGFVVNFPMSFQPLPLFDKFAFNQPAGGFLDEGQVGRVKAIFPDEVTRELSKICLSNEDAVSLAEGVRSMPDLSEEEIFSSLRKTLESQEFEKSRKDILQMIEKGEFEKAFAFVGATQRAMMRAITGILYNPFYEARSPQ